MLTFVVLLASLAVIPPDLEGPVRSGATSEEDAAVIVGNEQYAFIPHVPFSRRDAQAFRDFLVYTRGVPPDRIQHLEGASAETIVAAVRTAAEMVGPEGTLWFYFAGHGAASPTTGERMLLGDDVKSNPTLFELRAVKVNDIKAAGNAAHSMLLVIDACYSGVGRGGEPLGEGKRLAVPSYALSGGKQTAIWTAAQDNEMAGPYAPAKHGVFTYFVIGAMRGWADGILSGRPDDQVTLDEAQEYVGRAMRTVQESSQAPAVATESSLSQWVLSSGNLEEGPDLREMPQGGGPIVPAPSHSIGVGTPAMGLNLDQLRQAQEGRESLFEEAVSQTQHNAREDWARTSQVAQAGGPEGELALRAFVDSYQGATVEVDGIRRTVEIPEVLEAVAWVDRYGALSGGSANPLSLVRIRPGEFLMGSPPSVTDRSPGEREHRVRLTRAFRMGATEVTQNLFESVMGSNPSNCNAGCGPDLPVQNVEWYEAVEFCNRLSERDGLESAYQVRGKIVKWNSDANGYRLPTEAEWEYAARAAGDRQYTGTDDIDNVCTYANVANQSERAGAAWVKYDHFECEDGHSSSAAPVGSFHPNDWGIYDMTGNVAEWTWDLYADEPPTGDDPVVSKATGKPLRVHRGGSFNSYPQIARVTFRHGIAPDSNSFERGFRIVRNDD